VRDDPVCERWPDAGKRLDLALRRVVQIDGVDRPITRATVPSNRLSIAWPVTPDVGVDPRERRRRAIRAEHSIWVLGRRAKRVADDAADLTRGGPALWTGDPDAAAFRPLLRGGGRLGRGGLAGEGLLLERCRYRGSAGAYRADGAAE
jgi:hypothetical protein